MTGGSREVRFTGAILMDSQAGSGERSWVCGDKDGGEQAEKWMCQEHRELCGHPPALNSKGHLVPTLKSSSIPRGDCRVCHWLFVLPSNVAHVTQHSDVQSNPASVSVSSKGRVTPSSTSVFSAPERDLTH